MLELSQNRSAVTPQARTAKSQPRKLMLALALLLIALVAVLINDRQFWFGAEQATIVSDLPETRPASQASAPAAAAAPAGTKNQGAHAKKSAAATTTESPAPAEAPIVATNRMPLPPLDVEVVGGQHAHAAANSAKIQLATPAQSVPSFPAATNAAEREPVAAPQAAFHATYPVLAQHMNVQGSVVLQAVIGADGVIENLKVMSGPGILATAAQQAVREWHFKPIYQHGQAVESKATITVNFTIKVADSSATTTLAETQAANTLVITR